VAPQIDTHQPTAEAAARPADSLSFEAPYLIEKLVNDRVVADRAEGELLFGEVKRYFLLSRSDRGRIWEMHSLRVDDVWHQFVLFTRQYIEFCNRYYGTYLSHSPSNAPESPKMNPGLTAPVATFAEFRDRYEELFGEPLPDCWYDERSITLDRRILDNRVGRLLMLQDAGRVELIAAGGEVVFGVSAIAADAISFMADAGAFYVRELPGDLDGDEKIDLVSTMVQQKLLRVG